MKQRRENANGASHETVSDHIVVPEEDRNVDWLKSALQAAIELEHSTLPRRI